MHPAFTNGGWGPVATAARNTRRFAFGGKTGLAVGGGALALTAYGISRSRSSGRNGLRPNASGGMGY